ncbi:hypothetical protein X777_17011 [Ooceraea biroi]|uniref:Uncharacterized protein n=1 Tax=Ooceraea biroi TaxID=2015173 RepID=A0A026VTE2_OOCBI|nr:hypothetical protein X777_17011 [Ooceraea biroi]
MPANKSNLSTPRKEKSGNGLIPASTPTVAAASRKKKRSAYGSVKHKKHCKQYLVSVNNELKIMSHGPNGHVDAKGTFIPHR